MRALTLTQPWASAVAVGIKRVETRSWATAYRGPLAIHAAKTMPKAAKEFYQEQWSLGRRLPSPLPLSAVVAVAELVGIETTEDAAPFLSRTELEFGNYGPLRFAWFLENVEALETPVPARGALGLWEWERTNE